MAARATARPGTTSRRRKAPGREPWQPNWRLIGAAGGLLAIAVGVVAELAVLLPSGAIGAPVGRVLALAVGWTAPLLPLWPIAFGVLGLLKVVHSGLLVPRGRLWGAALAHLALIGLFHLVPLGGPGGLARAQEGKGGGLVGFALGTGFSGALGPAPAAPLLLAGLALGALLAFDVTLSRALRWLLSAVAAGFKAAAAYRRSRQSVRIHAPRSAS